MKRIIVVDRYFYPDLQATSVLLTDLVSELSKEFEIEIICGTPSSFQASESGFSFSGNLKIKTLPVFQFNHPSFVERFLNYVSFLFAAPLALLFEKRPDAVLVQSSPPLLPAMVSIACIFRRVPYVYVCQDFFPGTAVRSGELKESWFTKLSEALHQKAIERAARVIVIGRDMKELLISKGAPEGKIEVIPNWVDLNEIKVHPKENAFSKRHQLLDKFVIMHSGNFGLVQDFDFLLDVARQLKEDKNIVWVLLGDGASKKRIMARAEAEQAGNILFLPFVSKNGISEMLAAADLHVVSLKPGLAGYSIPSKTYTLMASARPLLGLVDEKSETARVIHEAECGVVISGKPAGEVAKKIHEIQADKKMRQKWGENARKFMDEKNFREFAFQNYKKILKETAL